MRLIAIFCCDILIGPIGTHEEKLVKQSKRLKGKNYRDQAMAHDDDEVKEEVKEEVKPAKAKSKKRKADEDTSVS